MCCKRPHGRKQTLSRLDCFETLHLSFASSKRLMRILRSIVGTQSLLVQSREANFAKRRSVGSEFVGDDYRRNEALTSKQFPQRPQRPGLVALGLDRISRTSPSLSTARHMYICRPAIETIISSSCHRLWGLGRIARKFLAIIGPNLRTHRRIDSLLTISPSSAKRSSTSR
jgi:hypothetical protein